MRELCALFKSSFLIIGIGSPLRSDDQAGLLLCDELINRNVNCIKCEYGIENCLDIVNEVKPEILVVIDTALFKGGTPGDIILVNERNLEENILPITTHGIPLKTIVELLKAMGSIKEFYLLGIYPKTLEIGLEVSSEVYEAAINLANRVKECVKVN